MQQIKQANKLNSGCKCKNVPVVMATTCTLQECQNELHHRKEKTVVFTQLQYEQSNLKAAIRHQIRLRIKRRMISFSYYSEMVMFSYRSVRLATDMLFEGYYKNQRDTEMHIKSMALIILPDVLLM